MKPKETVLSIAMKNTIDFLEEQSGMPGDFFENVKVIPFHHAIDVINDMAEQIKLLTDKLNKK